MSKKTTLNVLSSTAIAGLIVAAVSSTAYAKVTNVVVQDKDGKQYEYDYNKLADSLAGIQAADYFNNFSAKLVGGKTVSYVDDKTGFVDASKAANAVIIDGKDFKTFTESATTADLVNINASLLTDVVLNNDGTIKEQPHQAQTGVTVSSVSAITTTTAKVTFAADTDLADTAENYAKFNLTVNDGTAFHPTKITKVDSKNYTLTFATLDNTQGVLKVNGTAADLINKGKTTEAEYNFDFKAPEVTAVQAVDSRHLKVTFSEKMDASAADAVNFALYKLGDAQAAGTNLLDTTAATTDAFGVLSADSKSVVFTLKDTTTLAPATYYFNVATAGVKDIQNSATYVVANGTQLTFAPKASELTDVTAPKVVSAAYNSETKKLAVQFDETVKVSSLDYTKVKLGGVALTSSDAIEESSDSSKLTFRISDATKAKLPAGAVSLEIAAGAVTDIATTANAIEATTVAAVQLQTPPSLVAANSSYDENTRTLTLKFDQKVTIGAKANIQLGGVALDDAKNVWTKDIDKTATDTVTVVLAASDASAAGISGVTVDKIKATIPVSATVKNEAGTPTTLAIDSDIAMTQDIKAPSLVNATFKNLDKKLYFELDEAAQVADIANGTLKIGFGTDDPVAVSAAIVKGNIKAVDANGTLLADQTAYSKYLVVDLPTDTATITGKADGATSTTGQIEAQLQTAYSNGVPMTIQLGANAFYDFANDQTTAKSNGNLAMAKPMTLNFANSMIPTVSTKSATADDNTTTDAVVSTTQLKVTFDARMNKDEAENVNNYTIVDKMYSSKAYKVTKATLGADQKTVYLVVDNAMTDVAAGATVNAYKLTVANVHSVDGVALSTTANNFEFEGIVTAADTTAPAIKTAANDGVVLTSTANKENDTIAITFDANDVSKATAENLANYQLFDLGTDGNSNTEIKLDSNSVSSISFNGTNKATMTLKTIDLQQDHQYKVVVNNIADNYGNVIVTTDKANERVIKPVADNAQVTTDVSFVRDIQAPTTTALGSVQTGKTTVVVTFGEDVVATTAQNPANYRVTLNDGTNVTPTSVAYDATTKKATFDIPNTITGTTFKYAVKGVKDLAGNAATTFVDQTGVLADLVAPAFDSTTPITAEAKDEATPAADVITLKFTEAVNDTKALDETNYVVKINDTTLAAKGAIADTDTPVADTNDYVIKKVDSKTFQIVLGKADGTAPTKNFLKGDTVTVTAKNIEDLIGNKMADTTVSTTAINNVTAANTAIAAADVVIKTANTIELTFADDLAASTVSASDFVVDSNVVTKAEVAGKKVTLTVAAPVQDGAKVTVKASSNYDVKDAVGNALDKALTTDGVTSAAAFTAPDTMAPTASVGAVSVTAGTDVTTAQSNELGTVYLVKSTDTVTDKASLDALVAGTKATKATVGTINNNTTIATTNLAAGSYHVYAVDAAGNVSAASTAVVTVTAPITNVTSSPFTLVAANNTVTITLTGGTFKAGTITASDFTFSGTDNAALAGGTFTRTSDTVVTITGAGITGLTGTDNTVLVKAATQATQATSVAAVASTN
ncbi:beta strand repeat-containing protein [Clostridium drakei]|uniref:SbsA Ig-like domain-containing protein n=1 Tax=Clostridium drakei TaxID=332101 RepID=A0A2U8DK00_9CLOT|nr:hypothetical protein [Clostridium drakei]AWI03096.1 hypothetical protein B9W14_00760 [Clostridium drakei]